MTVTQQNALSRKALTLLDYAEFIADAVESEDLEKAAKNCRRLGSYALRVERYLVKLISQEQK